MVKFKKHETSIVETNQVDEGTSIWHHAHVREGARIGKNCVIGKNAYVDIGVSIGNNVKIQNNACVYSGTTVQDDVFIGPGVIFTNDLRPRAFLWDENRKGYITVGKGASLGAGVIVVCGTKQKPRVIGEYSMCGAGSIITKDVPPHALIIGNPGRVVGFVCICGEKISESDLSKCKTKCLHVK